MSDDMKHLAVKQSQVEAYKKLKSWDVEDEIILGLISEEMLNEIKSMVEIEDQEKQEQDGGYEMEM